MAQSYLCKERPVKLMLLPFVWDKTASGTTRSRTRGKSRPRGSLVQYKSEENQFHPVLASLGMGVPMLLHVRSSSPSAPEYSLLLKKPPTVNRKNL